MKIAELAGRTVTPEWIECVSSLDLDAPSDYRELAGLVACEWSINPPRVVGLAGGQGAGKSTFAALIAAACSHVGLRACVLSLDDFYHPLRARRELADQRHPLFETRGPPGTHDMQACLASMTALLGSAEIELPVFDKGRDDRSGKRVVQGPFDLVLLEGWCVGAMPESAQRLVEPVNSLEAIEDADSVWRRGVNEALAREYESAWRLFDYLIYLHVPDLDAVRSWRLQQENDRPENQRLDAAAVDQFVAYFERITLSMARTLPSRADMVIRLARDHSVSSMTIQGPSASIGSEGGVRPGST